MADPGREWPAHVWWDCARDGHSRTSENAYCTVCGQAEGEIVDPDLCPGVRDDSMEAMDTLIEYHYSVVPVLRPATADDLHPGRFVVIFDAGVWQYPGKVLPGPRIPTPGKWEVENFYGEKCEPDVLALEWVPGEPCLGVYAPYNAEPSL